MKLHKNGKHKIKIEKTINNINKYNMNHKINKEKR